MTLDPSTEDTDPFALSGPVGRDTGNRADVIKAQVLLSNAGYLDLPSPGVPTGWPGSDLASGITRLQKDSGLAPDGILLPQPPGGGVAPDGTGETLSALRGRLRDRLDGHAAPTPDQVDGFWSGWMQARDGGMDTGNGTDRAAPRISTAQDRIDHGLPQGVVLGDGPPAVQPPIPQDKPLNPVAERRAVVADLLDDPRVRAFLDTLADRESGGRYNVINGGRQFDDYARHPNTKIKDSTAAGAYQFIHSTWAALASQLGLKDFTPESQDQAAVHLLNKPDPEISSAIEKLQRGDIEGAIFSAGSQWDAFPLGVDGISRTGGLRPLQPIIDQYNKRLRELR